MKIIIAGSRKYNNYEEIKKAISLSGFEITEVVSGKADGVDTLGEQWARENNIPVKSFPPNWQDITVPGAIVKTNSWGKLYNAAAGNMRNKQMAIYGDGLIAIDLDTTGTNDMIREMKKLNKPIFHYIPEDSYGYEF